MKVPTISSFSFGGGKKRGESDAFGAGQKQMQIMPVLQLAMPGQGRHSIQLGVMKPVPPRHRKSARHSMCVFSSKALYALKD